MSDDQSEKIWAIFCHLGTFLGFIIPLANVVVPLVVWLVKKDDSPFIATHAKESLNFQISMLVYCIIGFFLWFFLIGMLLLPLLLLFDIIVVVMASIEAGNNRAFRYPLSIRCIQ